MYAIKRETEDNLCHGCLSADRRLSPLKNYEMYFAILGHKQTLEEYKYLNIVLCWECQALLRRSQEFRNTLQQAQYMLSVAQTEMTLDTLSALKHTHKQDYDSIIEETIDTKTEVEIFVDINKTIKKEVEDNIETDHFDNNSDGKEDDTKPPKKKNHRREREKMEVKKIDNNIDLRNSEKYFIQVCLNEMELEEALENVKKESFNRPHVCSVCGFWFVNKSGFYEHKRTFHKQRTKSVKCQHCAISYKTLWELEMHCWRSHPVNRCSICGRVVAHARDRAKHLAVHRFSYRCLKCKIDFGDKQWFQQHHKQLHYKYTCDDCSHVAPTKKRLEKHIIRLHLFHKCPTCALPLGTWERLRRHVRDVHERTGPAYCVECDISFVTPAKYRRHLSQSARHRPKKKISVPCPECGKVFSRKTYMNNHMKLFHSNQSRHHCTLCDKYFVNGFTLRSHHRYVHEKIPMPKNKVCSVCGRGFGTNRVLENHMRTHTGERPFACAHCSAAFAQRVALRAHLAAIHKEKGLTAPSTLHN